MNTPFWGILLGSLGNGVWFLEVNSEFLVRPEDLDAKLSCPGPGLHHTP